MDSTIKEKLHRIIDLMPDNEIPAVQRFVEFIMEKVNDPMLLTLALAPIDDEPLTEEEIKESEEGWQEYIEGKGIPWEEVREELADE